MSTFDPSAFLDFTTTEESVKRPPIPVGDYTGVIGDVTAEPWLSSKDHTKSGMKINVVIDLDLPGDVVENLNLNSPTLKVRDSIMLDLTAEGAIDMAAGKNGKLRKYREATNNNKKGSPFNARMLSGQVITVKVGHREYPEGSGDYFENVEGIAAHN